MALAALALALVGVPLTLVRTVSAIGWLLDLVAVIVSISAISKIARAKGAVSGKGVAVAGLVISAGWIALVILAITVSMLLKK